MEYIYEGYNNNLTLEKLESIIKKLNNEDEETRKELFNTPEKIAHIRMFALGKGKYTHGCCDLRQESTHNSTDIIPGGIAVPLVEALEQSIHRWFNHFPKHDKTNCDYSSLISNTNETNELKDILNLHRHINENDVTLAEEIAKTGSHQKLSKLIRLDIYKLLDDFEIKDQMHYELVEDTLVEIQDLACEVAYGSSLAYPVHFSPFTTEELLHRLPLVFNISSPVHDNNVERLIVRQVTERQSAQDDVGFVMWPSAVVLASYLLENKHLLKGKRVLEIGAGCALTGLVAAKLLSHDRIDPDLSSQVIITDFNRVVLENIQRNILLNDAQNCAKATKLDFYVQRGDNINGGWKGVELESLDQDVAYEYIEQPPVHLVLAADTICKPSDAVAVSKTIFDALVPGGEALIISADANHRFGVDIFESECKKRGLIVNVTDVADLYDGKLLPQTKDSPDPCGLRLTSGYVDGMALKMFHVKKNEV
jgi:predicted nicotinamide N-methyase